MGNLNSYAKSSKLMDISFTLDEKRYSFNLASELKIDSVTLNTELKKQPTHYAFLSMVFERVNILVEELESSLEKRYNQLYVEFKTDTSTTYYQKAKKLPSDDLCKSLVLSDKRYTILKRKLIFTKQQRNILKTAVKSFEQRAFLIQTLSANNRKQL